MKKMCIKLSDTERLTAALNEVQGRCTARTITVEDICTMCGNVFDHIGITKKAMDGVSFSADYNAQDFPSAYKYIPQSTHISAEYKRGEWRVTNIERWNTRRYSQRYHVYLTDVAKQAIIDKHATFC